MPVVYLLGWNLTCVDLWIPGASTVAGFMTGTGTYGAAGKSNASSAAVSGSVGFGYG